MKRINKLFMALLVLTMSISALAQNVVKGIVKDSENYPLMGAGVQVKGTTNGTVTDISGAFQISAAKGDVLVITFIGSQTVELTVSDQANYEVTLQDDTNFLDEVVVVGYDVQKKVNLTGAVVSLSGEALENKPITQASTALQGIAPGVTVTTQSGAPGGDKGMIRVRGIGTFGGSSAEPLVLIDGVEGDLNSIDASQIDKISVLKDAASSAIYGSRAANGVILVTTKRGTKGQRSITYRGYAGWQTPTRLPSLVGPEDYMRLNRESYENDGKESIYTDEYIRDYMANHNVDPDTYPITDWQKAVLTGSGFTHNHELSLTAGGDRITTNTSVGYLSQDGIINNTDYQRYNFRSNTDVMITPKVHLKFDVNGSYSHRNRLKQQNTIFNYMNTRDPLILSKYSSGYYASLSGSSINIRAFLNGEGGNVQNNVYNLSAAATLSYEPFPWLTIEGKMAPRFVLSKTHDFEDSVTTYADAFGTPSSFKNTEYAELTESSALRSYGNYLATMNFHKSWNNAHNFRLLLGASRETYKEETLSAYRKDFPFTGYEVINAGSNNEYKDNGGAIYEWKLQSFFGRVNYNYKERYLFEANVRFDGSSRFAKGHRWGVFPSGSFAWRITEEPWMASVKNILTEAKLRASYGTLGNQNIGTSYYPTVQTLNVAGAISMNNVLTPIATLTTLANPDITWEVSSMADVGIDLALFNKVSATFDWYYKTTSGILMELDIPQTIGLNKPYQNAGVVRNVGWELALSYSDSKGDFSWGVSANLSDVKNTIIDMKGTTGGSSGSFIRNQEGYAINSIYGYKCLGIVRSQEDADAINTLTPHAFGTVHPGDLYYADIAGKFDENGNPIPDGKVNDSDRTIIGSTIPRYTYGLTLDFGWKGINVSAFFQGVGKADGLLASYYIYPCYSGGTYRSEALGRFIPSDESTWATATYPRLSITDDISWRESTYWMANAAYCRLKNLQISYTLPSKLTSKAKIHKLTFFANAQNLFTITKFYQGYDPEVAYSGSNDGVTLGSANNYPQVKTFTFGVDIKF